VSCRSRPDTRIPGGTYYLFSTGDPAGAIGNGNNQIRTSANLRTWTYAGSYLVYHYYDAFDSGDAWVQVRPLSWVDGWPVTGRALVPVPGEQGPPGS